MFFRKAKTSWALLRSAVKGWRSDQRIVVIESDDWGSIRTSSNEAYDGFVASGYDLARSPYSLDALETDEDLSRLFEVLESVRDSRGRPACMTANMVVANPDFDRIRQADFRQYFYEPTSRTLLRHAERRGVRRLWREGLERNVFIPQLHAREHVCWWRWLEALRSGSREALDTFDLGMCGVPLAASKENTSFFSPMYLTEEQLTNHGANLEQMLRDGARLFAEQFGYQSLSVTAPNYCWTDRAERIWSSLGIRYIQGTLFQFIGSRRRRRAHFMGERSLTGVLYLVRNCIFEPASGGTNWADRCSKQVARAFSLHKPAVICTHRVNFIGAIRPENRAAGLRQFDRLLKKICGRWGDVFFLSSVELGYMIEHGLKDVRELEGLAPAGQEAGYCD